MKLKRTHILLVTIAVLLTIVTYEVNALNQDPVQEVFQSRPSEPARENMLRNQLNSLLTKVGIQLGALPKESSDHKRLVIHWQSGLGAASQSMGTAQADDSGTFASTASSTRPGAVSTPRSLELSTSQTFVAAIDESKQLVWWTLVPDPRILRAEVPDENGQQHLGRTLYLPETDFAVAYPNDPAIRELRFYQPVWDGKEFQLKLIGSVSVDQF